MSWKGMRRGTVFVAPMSDERRYTSASVAEPAHVMSYNLDLWAPSSQKASLRRQEFMPDFLLRMMTARKLGELITSFAVAA